MSAYIDSNKTLKLLNTKVGELLLNIYPPASMDIEPVSSNKIIDLVN